MILSFSTLSPKTYNRLHLINIRIIGTLRLIGTITLNILKGKGLTRKSLDHWITGTKTLRNWCSSICFKKGRTKIYGNQVHQFQFSNHLRNQHIQNF